LPDLVYDENGAGSPFNPDFITILERYCNNHDYDDKKAYKLLDILLDKHLTLDYHENQLYQKIIQIALLLYSHLSYCPIILNCLSKSNVIRLEKIQNKAIRKALTTLTPSRSFTTTEFYHLNFFLNNLCTPSFTIMHLDLFNIYG